MEKIYFITATGTDAGKTFVAEGLTRTWRARGMTVRALKPVMSGYDAAAPERSDAGRLLAAGGMAATPANIDNISPWRFSAPRAPDLAGAGEGRPMDFDDLIAWCRREVVRSEGAVLLEGIGGVMTPLDTANTVRDWIAVLDIPVLLVAGTYLGAISHTLTALAALREVGVVPTAVVVNDSVGGIGVPDTMASLAPHVENLPLLAVGRDDVAGLERLATLLAPA